MITSYLMWESVSDWFFDIFFYWAVLGSFISFGLLVKVIWSSRNKIKGKLSK